MAFIGHRSIFRIAAGLAALSMFVHSASAVEVVVKNDSIVNGSSAAICVCFAAGEEAAAWLTSPCTGNIVAVQVFWRSAAQNTPQSLEEAITIYSAGVFPNPGPIMTNPGSPPLPAVLEGPVLTDGFLNEFRHLDEQQTIPLNIPVTQGQVFVVSLEFANSNEGNLNAASIVRDADGCQAGKNTVNAQGFGWISSCLLGVQGDWMIRAVVACPDTGGCCLNNGQTCMNNMSQANCVAQGGTYLGANVVCNANSCRGACCIPPSTCLNVIQSNCTAAGSTFGGVGTACGTFVCFPTGACCLQNGTCTGPLTPAQCQAQGGAFQGNGIACVPGLCPLVNGACCIGTLCVDGVTTEDCAINNGVFQGPNTTCSPTSCARTCPEDINNDNVVNIDDLLSVINHWGPCAGCVPPGNCVGDVTHNCVVNIDDLLAVINGWGPC